MRRKSKRNGNLFDRWSIVHLLTGILMGWLIAPLPALLAMIAWEPLEVFVLSPLLDHFGIMFGYESFRNSISDMFFDAVGVVIGAFVLTTVTPPPIHFL